MAMPSPCETAGRPHTRAVSTSEHRVAAATRRLSRVVRTDCIVLLLDDHFFLHATHQSRGGRDFDALLGQGNKVSQFQFERSTVSFPSPCRLTNRRRRPGRQREGISSSIRAPWCMLRVFRHANSRSSTSPSVLGRSSVKYGQLSVRPSLYPPNLLADAGSTTVVHTLFATGDPLHSPVEPLPRADSKIFTSAAVVVITRETNYNLAIQPVSPRRLFVPSPGRVPWIPGADLWHLDFRSWLVWLAWFSVRLAMSFALGRGQLTPLQGFVISYRAVSGYVAKLVGGCRMLI